MNPESKGWVESVVRDIDRSKPNLVEKPQRVLKRIRDEARRSSLRPVVAPAHVRTLLNTRGPHP